MMVEFFTKPLCFQSELDNVNGLLSEAEGKIIKFNKDLSSSESQLQDSQVCMFLNLPARRTFYHRQTEPTVVGQAFHFLGRQ